MIKKREKKLNLKQRNFTINLKRPFGGESPKIIDVLSEVLISGDEKSTMEIVGTGFGDSSDTNYVVAKNTVTSELTALPIQSEFEILGTF